MQTCYTYDKTTKRLTPAPKYAAMDEFKAGLPRIEWTADAI